MDRTRRLRQTAVMRSMVRENHVRTEELIYPLFVMEGENIVQPVESMPGICQYSVDRMNEELDRVKALQIPAILIFGIPEHKDEVGSGAYDEHGIVQTAIRRIKKDFDKLKGIVDVYPFINPMGLEAQVRDVPVFDIDMNTLFPGSTEGTVGEYTAALVLQDIKGSDICVDLHSSSVYLKELPQVRVNSDIADDILPYAARMNTDVVWVHPSSTVMEGSLAYSLNEIGVKIRCCTYDRL